VTPQNRTGIGQKIQSLLSRSKVKLATRLRIQCRKAWGFKSPLPHYKRLELGSLFPAVFIPSFSFSNAF